MARRPRQLTYKATHWGTGPLREDFMTAPNGAPAVGVAPAKAVSYSADKGGKPEVYRHALTAHEGRGPMLLEAVEVEDGAQLRTPAIPDHVEMCGVGIDLELADGRVAFLGDCLVTYDPRGSIDELQAEHIERDGDAELPPAEVFPNAVFLHFGAKDLDGGPVRFALESRADGPFMTPRGIEE